MPRDKEVTHTKASEASFRLRPTTHGALVADLTPRASSSAGVGGDCGRVVVGFNFCHDVDGFWGLRPGFCSGIGGPVYGGVALEDRSVVGVGRYGVFRGDLVGIADHAEEGVRFGVAVNRPGGVELLMAAVLRVNLCEHEELDIVGIARAGPGGGEGVKEVGDFGGIEGKTEGLIGCLEGLEWGRARGAELNAANGERRMCTEEGIERGRVRFEGLKNVSIELARGNRELTWVMRS